ncbi:MAG TPA: hypothetical protein PLB59_09725 [Bacteroidales bacterium]|nr:hypothetical protein [Bacteroidales bacterium]HQP16236.1 hypothetical protein [Bacteroidales bacterium]
MNFTVNTPLGRGIYVREFFNKKGMKYITVQFFPPQHIINKQGKKMPNPNAGKYFLRSFRYELCVIEKPNRLASIYKKLVSWLNKK